MGCGCGRKATRTTGQAVTTMARPPAGANPVQTAQTFQSATIVKAPQAPVANTRKTD